MWISNDPSPSKCGSLDIQVLQNGWTRHQLKYVSQPVGVEGRLRLWKQSIIVLDRFILRNTL
jgi:hypothetical protein